MTSISIRMAVLLICCGTAYSQAASQTQAPDGPPMNGIQTPKGPIFYGILRSNGGPTPKLTPEQNAIQVIKNLMSFPSPLQNGSVQLHRMGDHAAGYILQVLQTRPPLTDAEKQTVLDMLHMAYERPAAIASARQPTATLALLQQIDGSTQDFSLKLRVADTKDFVLAHAGAVQ